MNHTIDKPIGIDKPIQDLQNYLYKKLNWSKVEMFGRVYKNEVESGVSPQVYIGNCQYLKDVYLDSKNNAHIFFVTENEHKKANDSVRFTNEVKIVFMVNLNNLFPNIKHRADTEAQEHAYKQVKQMRLFDITGIETGLDTVLKGFNTKTIKKGDLQPWHVFAIVTNLTYQININYC